MILEPQKIVLSLFPIFPYLPWSDGTRYHDVSFFECWVLNQLLSSHLSPLSRGSLVPLCVLPLGWYHLHIWSCWYFSWQSWFQFMLHPAWHLVWCTQHKSFLVGSVLKNRPSFQEPQEMWVWSLGYIDPLEEEMATHCRIPAWKISWTWEPGGLWSMGLQRIGHNWVAVTFFLSSLLSI